MHHRRFPVPRKPRRTPSKRARGSVTLKFGERIEECVWRDSAVLALLHATDQNVGLEAMDTLEDFSRRDSAQPLGQLFVGSEVTRLPEPTGDQDGTGVAARTGGSGISFTTAKHAESAVSFQCHATLPDRQTVTTPTVEDNVFSAEAYNLPVPKIDGYRATKLDIRFFGRCVLDRTSDDDLALLEAMRMGKEVRLIVTGVHRRQGVPHGGTQRRRGVVRLHGPRRGHRGRRDRLTGHG